MSQFFKMKVHGTGDKKNIFRALDPKVYYRGLQDGLDVAGKRLVETARAGIKNPPKTGRFYIIDGRLHQASAPGQYPANLTGALQKSLGHKVDGLMMDFGANTKYAPALQQFEHPNDKRVKSNKPAPRPFLTLAHHSNARDFNKILLNSVRKAANI